MRRLLARLPRMKRFGTTTRIAFAMAMFSATVLLCLRLAGILSDGHEAVLESRTRLCEAVAVSCSQNVSEQLPENIQLLLESLKYRNPEVVSLGFRLDNGELLHQVGDHATAWDTNMQANVNRIMVPVLDGDQPHAQIEAAFLPPVQPGVLGFFQMPSVRVTLVAALVNLLGFSILLRRCFKHLDPSQVIPERVRSALDTMSEVILLVDAQDRLMHVNCRLIDVIGGIPDSYQGKPLMSLPWQGESQQVLEAATEVSGEQTVELKDSENQSRVYKLNVSPILDDAGKFRGRLLSLDDITLIEQQKTELRATLADLEKSQAEIAEQNEKLQFLATRDPMTGCFNRRSFFESFEKTWSSSKRYGHPLSCVMVDVDHFKSINDNHGHAMGDEVLKQVAQALLDTARDSDIVCRYGGEEFCVLLPHVDIEGGELAAERFRKAIAALEFDVLSVTASLGCSDRDQGAADAEGMLEQADKSLYHAKRNGRNQVCRFDNLTAASDEPDNLQSPPEQIEEPDQDVQRAPSPATT